MAARYNGDEGIRTREPLLARQVLAHLSYTHLCHVGCLTPHGFSLSIRTMGLSGLEPPTSRLSGVRSNLLSYKPINMPRHPPALPCRRQHSTIGRLRLDHRVRDGNGYFPQAHRHRSSFDAPWHLNSTFQRPTLFHFLRKEVIQPHLPIRLPCYDFTPVIRPAFDSSLRMVGSLASGITDSHGVTGGVYKTRERIHRGMLIRDY